MTVCFLHFSAIQSYEWCEIRRKNFCCISVVLKGHLFKNLHVFFYFIELYVFNFAVLKKKDDFSLQEYTLPYGNFFPHISKIVFFVERERLCDNAITDQIFDCHTVNGSGLYGWSIHYT